MEYNKTMHRKIVDFIKYNNAFTIIFVLLFFGFGIGFAANPEMRDAVYSSEEIIVSVDNGRIVSADLDNFDFNLRINSITEDDKNYYAAYSYQTLAIKDDFWQNKEIEKTLTVSKEALGGKDLGLYVAEELGENIRYELSYLKRVQKLEKEKGESRKIVAVTYSGLVGKLLNPKEEVIEGYNPVIPEDVPVTAELNLAAIVVSTTPPQTEPAQEAASTPQPSPEALAGEALPAPEEMINEGLVQEVVEGLLQEQATSTPASEPVASALEATSTSEVIQQPAPETTSATSAPEVVSTPEAVSQPSPEASAGEALPAPEEMQATSTQALEPAASTTPEVIQAPAIEATSTPTSTPEVI